MKSTHPAMALILALALLAPATTRAQGATVEDAATTQEPAAVERLVGTVLQFEPRTAYERAILRVAGPRGYALTKRFGPGEPLEADLLAEAERSTPDGAAGAAQRRSLREGSRERVPWNALPDGRYVFEVVLSGSAGRSRAHVGHVRVENGAATRPLRQRPDPARAERTSRSGGRLSEKAFTEPDFIKIDDGGDDGTTFLTLDSDTASNTPLETWGLFNRFGDFTIEECGDAASLGSCQRVSLALLDDQDHPRVGIGTAAPDDVDLHIASSNGRILLEDTGESSWMIEEFNGGLDLFLFSPSPFRPGDEAGTKLFITGAGRVGISKIDPDARLHVAGNAIIEGDVALGSSRTIKHAVEPVDSAEVLAAIRELPLYSWRYRADPVQALHVGPMAEDVHAAFHVGRDDKHLSPGDSAGLALAAIQGVDSELQRMRDQLARRLAELEQLVAAALLVQAQGTAEPGACE